MSSNSTSTLPTKDEYFRDLKADPALANYEDDCPVCYDPIEQAIRTSCGHIVCLSCLTKCMALKNTCPLCRREQYQEVLEQEHDEDDNDLVHDENDFLPFEDEFYVFALDWSGANQMFDVYEDPDEDEDGVHESDDEDAGYHNENRFAEGEDAVGED